MQKGFIFLMIIWNSSLFASGNTTKQLRFLLGCQAVIPCQQYRGGLNSFEWFYEKDGSSGQIQLFFQDEKGVKRYQQLFRDRIKVLPNGSLVIDDLTEDDQGLYWCESCFQGQCSNESYTVTSLNKEILTETNNTVYATAGRSFTRACPTELTNFEWTFEASNMTQRPESNFVTSKNSIHIVNVKRANLGKYTCWISGCKGHKQKLHTIILCMISVHHSKDSSVSCAVMCDMEFSQIKPNSASDIETDTRTLHVDPYGFLKCSTKPMFDGHSTINSTPGPSNALNKTTGIPTEPKYWIPVIYGTSAALTFLILIALLICYLRGRLGAAIPAHLCCCSSNGMVDQEISVVYSSIVIRGHERTTNNPMTPNECVYSEIKV